MCARLATRIFTKRRANKSSENYYLKKKTGQELKTFIYSVSLLYELQGYMREFISYQATFWLLFVLVCNVLLSNNKLRKSSGVGHLNERYFYPRNTKLTANSFKTGTFLAHKIVRTAVSSLRYLPL